MKRTVFVSCLLVCLLALGLIFASCDNGTTSGGTKFEGSWVNTTGDLTTTIAFTNNSVLYKNNKGISRPGTFTFTNTEITFIPKEANTWTGWTQGYTLDGKVLTLQNDGNSSHASGQFTKQ